MRSGWTRTMRAHRGIFSFASISAATAAYTALLDHTLGPPPAAQIRCRTCVPQSVRVLTSPFAFTQADLSHSHSVPTSTRSPGKLHHPENTRLVRKRILVFRMQGSRHSLRHPVRRRPNTVGTNPDTERCSGRYTHEGLSRVEQQRSPLVSCSLVMESSRKTNHYSYSVSVNETRCCSTPYIALRRAVTI